MHPASSTWRSSLAAVALIALLPAGSAWAQVCWPPVVEDGQRLQRLGDMPVTWLPLLFRQHEVCWRRGDDERRVFLTGSSGVHGFPLPARKSVAGQLNSIGAHKAHFYNLGHLFTYQVKDALVVRESLRYRPDLIVHMLVLSDFVHRAPIRYQAIETFLEGNRGAVAEFAREAPPGLADPLARIRDDLAGGRWTAAVEDWRQTGRFVRMTANAHARRLRASALHPVAAPPPTPPDPPSDDPDYDCAATLRQHQEAFAGWTEWNILEYLAAVREQTGVRVVVVDWPVARRPRGRCSSVRYPKRALREYRRWLRQTSDELDLPLLDYSTLLAASDFFDSIHPTAEGHRKIATQLAIDLAPHLAR